MGQVLLVGSLASSLIRFEGPSIDALLEAGHQLTCAASEPDAETKVKMRSCGIAFHPLALKHTGTRPLADLNALREIICLLRRLRPDVVFAYTDNTALYRCFATRIIGSARPYEVITGLGYTLTPDWGVRPNGAALCRWIASRVLPYASRVYSHHSDDRQFSEAYGLTQPIQGLVVEGAGVSIDALPSATLRSGHITFLCVARLLRNKDTDEFVKAARFVHPRYPDPRSRIVIARDANPQSVTNAQLAAWQRDSPFAFLGYIASPWSEFAASHVSVPPAISREELPSTFLETMPVVRAVITSDLPGCPEGREWRAGRAA